MKINEIIRERRLAKHYTQEQVASFLGVTAPAVNKWEKGTSYPDITILSALARLLDTDLNTLLSFEDDLSEPEIEQFIKRLSEISEKEEMGRVFDTAMAKIREYPSCCPLILNVALFLDGTLMLHPETADLEELRDVVEDLYRRVLPCSDPNLRGQAQSMLISRFMGRKEFEKARQLLDTFPDAVSVDKKQIEANLHIACGELETAAKLAEEKLLAAANEVYGSLITLMDIALKENRREDAAYLADISKRSAELLDLWEYSSYVAHFQLYVTEKNREQCLKVLKALLESLDHPWDIRQSPLYQHMDNGTMDGKFAGKVKNMIVQSLGVDEETAFLNDSGELNALLEHMNLV